jgi:hypothetical protein
MTAELWIVHHITTGSLRNSEPVICDNETHAHETAATLSSSGQTVAWCMTGVQQ